MTLPNAKALGQVLIALVAAGGLIAGLVATLVGNESVAIAILLFLVTSFIWAELIPRAYEEWKGKEDHWTSLARLVAQHGMLELVDEDGIYDVETATSKELQGIRVYVPVGLWGLKEGDDPKKRWLLALQKRLQEQDPPLEFDGAYGLPPTTDQQSFDRALGMLRGFAGARHTELRVFPALTVSSDASEGLATAAPGIGILLATFRGGGTRLLVGCATKADSVRVDAGITITSAEACETFGLWYSRHVTKVGTKLLHLDSAEKIEEDIRHAVGSAEKPPASSATA